MQSLEHTLHRLLLRVAHLILNRKSRIAVVKYYFLFRLSLSLSLTLSLTLSLSLEAVAFPSAAAGTAISCMIVVLSYESINWLVWQ